MTDRTHPDSGRITNPGAAYATLPDERKAFEAMMRSQTFDSLKRLSDGSYESYEARVGWMAWNARASHGQASDDLLKVALAYKDYIEALPSDVVAALPAMPGIDGDWAAEVLDRAARAPADSVLEDVARYRYLRDVPMDQWPAELLTAIRLQKNAKWDAAIDAARKQGANHD